MSIVPWRLKSFLSARVPLLYHLAVNFGTRGNSAAHWDTQLAETWDAPARIWPTKNKLVASLTVPSEAIVDIGCGNGSLLRHLKARDYENLHGVEISRYAIRRLSEEGIRMHFGVLPRIPLQDAAFDVVIASQVLEHVIRRRRFLREMARVLKPGGRAFIFVPDNCLGPIDEPEHVARYNALSLRKVLTPGFSILSLESMRDANHPMSVLFAHVMKPVS